MKDFLNYKPPDSGATLAAEARRVAAVKALDLFGESVEQAYDDAVYLASVICGTPMSMVTVLEDTQRFKAKLGIDLTWTPKEESFCAHTIKQHGLFVVPDAHLDTRFRDLPLVTQEPNVRFYAGMPLSTVEGVAVGALCVCDTVPRELTEEQKSALMVLSRQVTARFDDRQKVQELARIILEKERVEEELKSSHLLFEAFMDNSPLVSFLKDAEGRLVYYNRSFAESFAITRQAWIGRSEYEFFPAAVAERIAVGDRAIFESDQMSVVEEAIPGPDGAVHIWKTYKFGFDDASGTRFLAGLCHDITAEKQALQEVERYHAELRKANEKLRELSLTDPLTGCWNRRAFDERLANELAVCERHGGDLSMLLLDIDNFKRVNDTFGHEAGDQVLCHVAAVLRGTARGTDLVCRYGGEEFAVLLPRTPEQGALLIAERFRMAIEAKWEGCTVTASIGVGHRSVERGDAAAMMRRVDEALYKAKSTGKNRVVAASRAA